MTLLVQHAFQGPSGEGDDHFINTFHMFTPGTSDLVEYFNGYVSGSSGPLIGETLAANVQGFYTGHASTSSDNPLYYLSRAVFNLGEYMKVYDLDAPPHTPPVFSYMYPDLIGTPTSARPLPQEVSLCVSIEGFISGVTSGTGPGSTARRRNRMYIGPFNQEAEHASTSVGASKPQEALMDALCREYKTLYDTTSSTLGLQFGVYSKTDDTFVTPTRVWCDDSWDTQRRRGLTATGRSQVTF